MQMTPALTEAMKRCIDDCQQCSAECLETAMHTCLEHGGSHTEPEHFRLMINCAQLCQTTASFMLSRSAFHEQLCIVCAEVCDACARSCEQIGGMDHCVDSCRRSAMSCLEMSGMLPGRIIEDSSAATRGYA